jgi:hypothetical protein
VNPYVAVAYGRYEQRFAGALTGFNVLAGPFSNDVRVNGLLKGAVLHRAGVSLLLPIAAARQALAAFLGVDPTAVCVLDDDDRGAIRRFWEHGATAVGALLRRLHRAGIFHGSADFGNVCVLSVDAGRAAVAFTDWELSGFREDVSRAVWRAKCLEDLISMAQFLVLESQHNPFFSAVSSAEHMYARLLEGYSDGQARVAALAEPVLANVCAMVQRGTDDGDGKRVQLPPRLGDVVDAIAGRHAR